MHALRHSLANHFDDIGVPPQAGAAWLGHRVEIYLSTYFQERGATGIAQIGGYMRRASNG